jgi:hypothetical protein
MPKHEKKGKKENEDFDEMLATGSGPFIDPNGKKSQASCIDN